MSSKDGVPYLTCHIWIEHMPDGYREWFYNRINDPEYLVNNTADAILLCTKMPHYTDTNKWNFFYKTYVHYMSNGVKPLPPLSLISNDDAVNDTVSDAVDPCEECGAPTVAQWGGGIKCTKCDWWFCY